AGGEHFVVVTDLHVSTGEARVNGAIVTAAGIRLDEVFAGIHDCLCVGRSESLKRSEGCLFFRVYRRSGGLRRRGGTLSALAGLPLLALLLLPLLRSLALLGGLALLRLPLLGLRLSSHVPRLAHGLREAGRRERKRTNRS